MYILKYLGTIPEWVELPGMASKTQILDCTVDGTLIGYDGYYGGIAGSASGTISGCEFSGSVSAAKNLQNSQSGQAYVGGIAGDFSSAVVGTGDESADDFEGIINCVNKGTIEIENGYQSALAAGGIAGSNSARITGCTNEGIVEAKAAAEDREELGTAALSIGGIAGSFVVAVLGEDGVLSGCENTGTVMSDSANTGGIVGTVDLSDPRYAVTIENCKNTGKVFSANHYYAGIAADIGVKADNTLTIAGCTNETDFTEGEGAGIVYELVMQKGNMLLSGNVNHGTITSSGQNAAGILCYTANMGDDWQLNIEDCENTADISSEGNVGGIAGFTAYYKTDEAGSSFNIQNCKNSGNLSSTTTNGYIGGDSCSGMVLCRRRQPSTAARTVERFPSRSHGSCRKMSLRQKMTMAKKKTQASLPCLLWAAESSAESVKQSCCLLMRISRMGRKSTKKTRLSGSATV